MLRAVDDAEVARTEQRGEVPRCLVIDGDAEWRNALQARLGQCLACILEPIAALVAIAVIRLAVGEQQQEAAMRGFVPYT